MVIAHNILAMNSNRQVGIVRGKLAKSTEKLSSGYKVNRAADDAAGLAISEKMRKQIRGLAQATENCEDGISLCQVADGALNETVNILQRMNELAVQAANGTNSEADRQDMQCEINQLVSEVDRIANVTKFNEIYLLGDNVNRSKEVEKTYLNTDRTVYIYNVLQDISRTFQYVSNLPIVYDGVTYYKGDYITVHGLTTDNASVTFDQGGYWDINVFDEGVVATGKGAYDFDKTGSYSLNKEKIKIDADGYLYYISQYDGDKYYLVWQEENDVEDPLGFGTQEMIDNHINNYGLKLKKIASDTPLLYKARKTNLISDTLTLEEPIWIQATDEANKGMSIHTVDATAATLKINELTVGTEDKATKSINIIEDAIKKVSGYRSYFGAIQNRLEHTINNLDNVIENTTAAESQIRDTDMATEMVKNSKYNILMQAGQSMLAQANQSNQGVLSLIA